EKHHKYLSHYKTDQSAARERKDPGQHHIFYYAKVDGRKPLDRSHSHDRTGLGMGRRHRNTGHTGQQKTKGSCQIRRKALELFQLHHIHPHRFDDLFSAHAGAHTHHCGTQHHQPYRDHHTFHTILAIAERHAKEQHADKLLTVLGSMHKTHKG